jgi:hypothetical protein
MSPDNGDVYIMSGDGDDGWVSPTPAQTAIVEAVTAATALEADDIETYTNLTDLEAALADGQSYTFTVEGSTVTIDPDGTIDVAD